MVFYAGCMFAWFLLDLLFGDVMFHWFLFGGRMDDGDGQGAAAETGAGAAAGEPDVDAAAAGVGDFISAHAGDVNGIAMPFAWTGAGAGLWF